jgi:peptidoglycan/LPS O-acetylase OafA/YrhL
MNNRKTDLFGRDETLQMKGIAILFIVIHNFVHAFGYSPANEFIFSLEKWNKFWLLVTNPSFDTIYHFFSFLGWCGVPVFVFISGYGLVKKYESHNSETISVKQYIFKNYKKLFFLLLPGACFYFLFNIADTNYEGSARVLLYLTLLNNFIVKWNSFEPGVYWYFGLAFQLYLVYILYNKYRNNSFLYFSLVTSFILLFLIPEDRTWYLKNNFFTWLPLFLIGIWAGRIKKQNKTITPIVYIPFFFILFILLILLNSNYFLWILIPFCAVGMFIALVKSVGKLSGINNVLSVLGTYSASLFVVHPIVRTLCKTLNTSIPDLYTNRYEFSIFLIAYMIITGVLAYFYNKLYLWLKKQFV